MTSNTQTDQSNTNKSTTQFQTPDGRDVDNANADAITHAFNKSKHPNIENPTDNEIRRHQLPSLRLPGFGEPEPDCNDYILPAMRFCTGCGTTHEFKHNCLRYDCPHHAPYAVRRRAKGAKKNPQENGEGLFPRLDAIKRTKSYHNNHPDPILWHHLVIDVPDDFLTESDEPLKRMVGIGNHEGVIRSVMDELGIQGAVVYHPWRGENDDDRGFWQEILFHNRDWNEIYDEKLVFDPHFHIIGVARYVDISVTEEVQERTGFPIHRRQDDDTKRSIERRKDEDTDDPAAARALLYCLSHAGVYETDNGDRRLAAWLKGPDVNWIDVREKNRQDTKAIVNREAEETLGILPPDLSCKCEVPVRLKQRKAGTPRSRSRATGETLEQITIDSAPGPQTAPSPGLGNTATAATALPRARSATDLPNNSDSWSNSSASGTTSDTNTSASGTSTKTAECKGYLKHISLAGDHLLDPNWRNPIDDDTLDQLNDVYKTYIDYMNQRNRDPLHDAPSEIPEYDPDPPPTD